MKKFVVYIFAVHLLIQAPVANFNDDIVRIIGNCTLIDGKTLFGQTSVYSALHIGCNGFNSELTVTLPLESSIRNMLKTPIKTQSWTSDTLYTATDFFKAYHELIRLSSQLNPSALRFFWHILADGNIYGFHIEGLTPQPKRAALFQELYEWRTGMRSDANHAFKAINDERERLETIAAAEAAQRKADADRRVAEQDTTQAPSTSIDYKPRGESNGLRRRHLPQDANGANDGTEMDTHTPHSPLIVAH